MKMVKSLLLGSAAGLVAVAGAQAADLPVKAKAVEYVKVCAAYGAGYFYVPGTDTCIKIGGYVRFDTYVNATGTFNPFIYGQTDNTTADTYRTRARAVINLDTRTQTEYGTLRSYFRFGMSADSWNATPALSASAYFERAFIQFAGFTAGYTQSFFNSGLGYMMTTPYTISNKWTNLLAYTAQFGNGFSATLSLEDGSFRTTAINAWGDPFDGTLGGDQIPDIVGNLRIDQAWGSAQLSGALHQVRIAQDFWGLGYDFATDQWGWAIGGTLEFNLPMLAKGDAFFITASYADGALNYAGLSGSSQSQTTVLGRVDSFGLTGAYYRLADAVWTGLDYQNATAWSIAGQFRHYWTPGLRSAIYGGYSSVDMPDGIVPMQYGFNDVDLWQVGFNTIWSPVKNLDIGAEILYSKIDGSVPEYLGCANAGCTSGRLYGGSTDLVSGGIRVQRNF